MSTPELDAADAGGSARAVYGAVFVGGMLGAVGRLGLGALLATGSLPWAVLLANLAGAFALGFLFERLREHRLQGSARWAFWGPGMLGAFTTFSALQLEAVDYIRAGNAWHGVLYLVMSIALGVPVAACGRWIAMRSR